MLSTSTRWQRVPYVCSRTGMFGGMRIGWSRGCGRRSGSCFDLEGTMAVGPRLFSYSELSH